MRSLVHPNILGLHDLIRPPSIDHFADVYILTARMDQDLQVRLGSYHKSKK
jgi:hypothetical protein